MRPSSRSTAGASSGASRSSSRISTGSAARAPRSARRAAAARFATVALVGYTNAGKSTLLNRLTHADVLVEDRLFSTLDPTTRRLRLPGGEIVLLSDTVGFVRRLPHQLVEAFRSTLEEVGDADLLVHVVDGERARRRASQIEAVRDGAARDRRRRSARSCSWSTRPTSPIRDRSLDAASRVARGRGRGVGGRPATGVEQLAEVDRRPAPRWLDPVSSSQCRTTAATCSPRCTATARCSSRCTARAAPGCGPGCPQLDVHRFQRVRRRRPSTPPNGPDSLAMPQRIAGGFRPAAVPARPARRRCERLAERGARRHRRLLGRHPSTRCPRSRSARSPTPRRGAPVPAVDRQRRRYREAAAAWIARRFGVARSTADEVIACIGTKELVASLPRALCAARPVARHRALPAISYPTYEMGAELAGPARGAGPARRPVASRPRAREPTPTPSARSCSGSTTREPDRVTGAPRARWPRRSRGRASAGSSSRATSATPSSPTTSRARRPRRSPRSPPASTACSPCTRCRSDRTWPGCAPGSSPATAELVAYLGEIRKHAGLMTPAPVQAAAAAALGDDEHVDEQRERYARRRGRCSTALRRVGPRARRRPVHLLPLAARRGRRPSDGWAIAAPPRRGRPARRAGRPLRCRRRGPRAARAHRHRRPTRAALALASASTALTRSKERRVSDLAEQAITALWEGRDDLAAVMPEAEARARRRTRRSTCSTRARRGSPRSSTARSSCTSG